MNNLIIFYGKPGNYKTYLSSHLAAKIGYLYVPTSAFLQYTESAFEDLADFRNKRYNQILNWLKNQETIPVNIVLDGGIYLDETKRREILNLKWNSKSIVFCNNKDEDLRFERIRIKAADLSDYESISAKDILANGLNNSAKYEDALILKKLKADKNISDLGIEINVDARNLKVLFSNKQSDSKKIIDGLKAILNEIK